MPSLPLLQNRNKFHPFFFLFERCKQGKNSLVRNTKKFILSSRNRTKYMVLEKRDMGTYGTVADPKKSISISP